MVYLLNTEFISSIEGRSFEDSTGQKAKEAVDERDANAREGKG